MLLNLKIFRLFLAGLLMYSGYTNAAQIELINGDRLTGKLVRMTDGIVVFQSGVFGEVRIPFDQVSSLISDADTTVILKDGSRLVGLIEIDQKGSLSMVQGQLQFSQNIVRSDLVALNPPILSNRTKYSGRANLGGTFNRGNSDENTLNLDAELVARTSDSRYTFGVEVNEGSSAGVTTTSNRQLSGKYDAFLTEKDYIFVLLKGESDELADLTLRSTLGVGYGRQFYESEIMKLSSEVGLSYVSENYKIAPDESFPSLAFGLNYDRKLFDSAMVLFNNTSMDISLEDSQDTLLKNKLGIRFPLTNGLNVSTQLNVDYDNQPAVGTKKTDTSLIFSVGYGF